MKGNSAPREVTWFDRSEHKLPDEAPLADPNERVMLRVPIGQREAHRATIPRLDPPAEVRMDPAQERGNEPSGATQAEGGPEADRSAEGEQLRRWPAPREELEELVRQGLTNREIGELYGVSAVTVAVRLSKFGIRRDPATRAELVTRGGRKGRQMGWKQNPLFKPKPVEQPQAREEQPQVVGAEQGETPVPSGSPGPAGDSDPLEEFGKYIARVIREASKMGLPVDVEIRLRAGGAA